jgi:hypothetical protein
VVVCDGFGVAAAVDGAAVLSDDLNGFQEHDDPL